MLAAFTAYFAYLSSQNERLYQETVALLKERGLDECYFYSLKHEGELCYIVSIDDKRYMLTGEAAYVYGTQLGREQDYKVIELRLPYLESDAKIHLMVSGSQEKVQWFVSTYDLNVIKSSKGAIGWITMSNLERFVSEVSMKEYIESGLDIGILGQVCDETGCIGPFEEPKISEEESQLIAKALEEYRNGRIKDILGSKSGVEVIG